MTHILAVLALPKTTALKQTNVIVDTHKWRLTDGSIELRWHIDGMEMSSIYLLMSNM